MVEFVEGRDEKEAEPRDVRGATSREVRWASRVDLEALMRRVTLSWMSVGRETRGGRDAQNVAVTKDGGEVVLEVFESDELFAPCVDGLCIALESVVGTGENVDDGSDGLGCGRCSGGVSGEGGECCV